MYLETKLRYLLRASTLALLLMCACSEKDEVIVVPEMVELGELMGGRRQLFTIPIHNPGNSAVPIRKVSTSCGCILSDESSFEILAGERKNLKVIASVPEDTKLFQHRVLIQTDSGIYKTDVSASVLNMLVASRSRVAFFGRQESSEDIFVESAFSLAQSEIKILNEADFLEVIPKVISDRLIQILVSPKEGQGKVYGEINVPITLSVSDGGEEYSKLFFVGGYLDLSSDFNGSGDELATISSEFSGEVQLGSPWSRQLSEGTRISVLFTEPANGRVTPSLRGNRLVAYIADGEKLGKAGSGSVVVCGPVGDSKPGFYYC